MAKANLPSPEELRNRLDYCPESGRFVWKQRPICDFAGDARRSAEMSAKIWNAKHAGKPAFTARGSGGLIGQIFGVKVKAHRAAWAIWHGHWPSGVIDHINGDCLDNRLCNLRDGTQSQNMKNKRVKSAPKSGAVGVYWHKPRQKWTAAIGHENRYVYLGLFCTKEAAMAARADAEAKYGFGPNHGLA